MQPGDVIAERYRLLRLLDVGGMGEVWAARNELTQKSFAIKFLLPGLIERPDALERFIREAETAGSLDHPSIVDVFDVAQAEDGRPFIVMELLSGESLEARLERKGPLGSLEAAGCLAQIADGLDMAHCAGIVHRDLSMANIFLARNPEGGRAIAKILDFGVSKTLGPDSDRTLTGHGAVLGCPDFMSPEQARGAETVDARTDVWSLGVVLYQCLTGAPPFRAKNYNALMVGILTRQHRPLCEVAPHVDSELAALVEACLVKDRNSRIQTAREAADRLRAIAFRIAGPSAEGSSPRRRATDRLAPNSVRSVSFPRSTSSPIGVEDARALSRMRPRAGVVGLVSTAFGIFIGAVLATVLRAAPTPTVSTGAPAKTVVPQTASTPRAPAPSGYDGQGPDVAGAMARNQQIRAKAAGQLTRQ